MQELRKALPKAPRMDGIASFNLQQRTVYRVLRELGYFDKDK